ncbi:MAG: hypothetical protein ABFD50_01900 [Smithella sp.]
MRNDFKKIKTLHDLQSSFTIDTSVVEELTRQIEAQDRRENIQRFYDGYSVEDNFQSLFSVLPWVKLNHALAQDQYPEESKEALQVPDFCLFYESADLKMKPLLIETKSVTANKQSLELMAQQVKACEKYANICGIPLLIAVYWKKYSLWTLNSVDQFSKKSKSYKISFKDAFTSNLSAILGDFNLIFTAPIFRKTIFDSASNKDTDIVHEIHGAVIEDQISSDGISYMPLEMLESAIIDSFVTMKEIEVKKNGSKTEVIERSTENHMSYLNTMILRHLGITPGLGLTEYTAKVSLMLISQLAMKLGIAKSLSIPRTRTNSSDTLFKDAFGGTSTWTDYLNFHR